MNLAIGGNDGGLKLLDLRKINEIETVAKNEPINEIALDDSKIVALSISGSLRVFNKNTFETHYKINSELPQKILIFDNKLNLLTTESLKIFNLSNGAFICEEKTLKGQKLFMTLEFSDCFFSTETSNGFAITKFNCSKVTPNCELPE